MRRQARGAGCRAPSARAPVLEQRLPDGHARRGLLLALHGDAHDLRAGVHAALDLGHGARDVARVCRGDRGGSAQRTPAAEGSAALGQRFAAPQARLAQGRAGARLLSSSSARAPGARCRPAPARSARPAARASQAADALGSRRWACGGGPVGAPAGRRTWMVRVGRLMLWYTLSQYFGITTCFFSGITSGPSVATAWRAACAVVAGTTAAPPERRAPTAKVRRRHMSLSTCEHARTVGDFTVCEACRGAAAAGAKQRARGIACMRRAAGRTAAVCCRAADRAALLLCCLSAACCRRGHPRWLLRASAGPAPPAGRLSLACILTGTFLQRKAFASLWTCLDQAALKTPRFPARPKQSS